MAGPYTLAQIASRLGGRVVGDAQIELGSDCDGQRACTPIPAGLQTLRKLLEALTAQQRVDPDCYPKP